MMRFAGQFSSQLLIWETGSIAGLRGKSPRPGSGTAAWQSIPARQQATVAVNQAAGDLVGTHLNAVFLRFFGAECDSVIQKVALSSGKKYGQTNSTNIYTITYSVTPRCLQAQFNLAFSNMHVTGQMGTGNGTRCHVFGSLSDSDANWT